jgi:hypothetical protein
MRDERNAKREMIEKREERKNDRNETQTIIFSETRARREKREERNDVRERKT